jgi:hypothetical protein
MKDLMIQFWKNHGERLVFMFLAALLALAMYQLKWVDESKVIIIALATLCLNKARGTIKNENKDT